jgi:L-tartrate/succinate antiporter
MKGSVQLNTHCPSELEPPVMLAVGAAVPGLPILRLSLMLAMCGGIMSILTLYAGGPNPVYYSGGYLPAKDFWRLGAVFGFMFFAGWLVFGLWWLPRH